MELHDYLAIARKRWLSIVLITAVALASAIAASLAATPTYQAKSQVFVSVDTGGSTADLLQGSNYSQKQVISYTDLVTSPMVLQPVIDQLDLKLTPDQLASSVTAVNRTDTVLIDITVTGTVPTMASDTANAIAASLGTQVATLERPTNGGAALVRISTVRKATPPTASTTPKTMRNIALGLALGVLMGYGLAVLREVLDTKVRTASDVRRVTPASVIGTVGYDAGAPRHPLIVHTDPRSHRAESFRRLRTNLQFIDIADHPKTIVVTSSLPGEGKSTTAINLALALADAGERVLVVDADLRRPSVAEYMGLEGQVGLTTVLIGQADLADVVQPWGDGHLHVLPSGAIPPNPSELLGSSSMVRLLEKLARAYDIVLIDTAPLLPVTDAAVLARLTGGTIVVVGAQAPNRQQLAAAMGALSSVGARVLGIVINRVARRSSDAYYDYHTPDKGSSGGSGSPSSTDGTRTDEHGGHRWAMPATSMRPARHDLAAPHGDLAVSVDLSRSPEPTRTTLWPDELLSGTSDEDPQRSG